MLFSHMATLSDRADTESGAAPDMGAQRHGRLSPWLVPAIYIGCLMAFLADLTSANTLAFGVFYAPLVGTAVFHRDARAVWVLAAMACAMVIIGSFFPSIAQETSDLAGNRILSICAVLATAVFVRHARVIEDRLAEQTRRTAAAERIKTEVLTNLSQEIRAPLHAMIGVMDLLALNSSPDQKTALQLVRASGRRLAATVDNLVDLTQIEEKQFPPEAINPGMILRQAVEAQRADASARQIDLHVSPHQDSLVYANPWALRRIAENLLADAILHTAPGEQILIEIMNKTNNVQAAITHNGLRPPGAWRIQNENDIERLTPSVMGVALSQRLARDMGLRLLFTSAPENNRTTVRLCLPMLSQTRVDGETSVSPR